MCARNLTQAQRRVNRLFRFLLLLLIFQPKSKGSGGGSSSYSTYSFSPPILLLHILYMCTYTHTHIRKEREEISLPILSLFFFQSCRLFELIDGVHARHPAVPGKMKKSSSVTGHRFFFLVFLLLLLKKKTPNFVVCTRTPLRGGKDAPKQKRPQRRNNEITMKKQWCL